MIESQTGKSFIFLRGVSVNDIIINKEHVDIEKIRGALSFSSNEQRCGSELIDTNVDNPIFKTVPVKGRPKLYVTINSFAADVKDYDTIPCVWCRLKVNWRCDDSITGVLISPSPILIDGKWKYPAKAHACCDGCHFAYLETDYTPYQLERIELLKSNYRRRTGADLKASPDWLLLKENGGSLTKLQFFGQKYKYDPTGKLVMHGCRQVYQVEQLR